MIHSAKLLHAAVVCCCRTFTIHFGLKAMTSNTENHQCSPFKRCMQVGPAWARADPCHLFSFISTLLFSRCSCLFQPSLCVPWFIAPLFFNLYATASVTSHEMQIYDQLVARSQSSQWTTNDLGKIQGWEKPAKGRVELRFTSCLCCRCYFSDPQASIPRQK